MVNGWFESDASEVTGYSLLPSGQFAPIVNSPKHLRPLELLNAPAVLNLRVNNAQPLPSADYAYVASAVAPPPTIKRHPPLASPPQSPSAKPTPGALLLVQLLAPLHRCQVTPD